jgi:hypothetical protein
MSTAFGTSHAQLHYLELKGTVEERDATQEGPQKHDKKQTHEKRNKTPSPQNYPIHHNHISPPAPAKAPGTEGAVSSPQP